MEEEKRILRHLGIILDGNGRWAQKRDLTRSEGHRAGMENVVKIARACKKLGVEVLSLYAFSTENWKRPKKEVKALILNIGLNYGGRDEIVRAVRKLARAGQDLGRIREGDLSAALDTAALPPLDYIIRTGGELRLSNFMIWQAAYAEFYFTDCLWPDFGREDLLEAVAAFKTRQRRFGGIQ